MPTSDVIREFLILDPYQKYVLDEFNKPLFENTFFKNIDYFKNDNNYNSVKFSKDVWNFNPMKFSYDEYEIMHFSNIILLVNNIPNTFEFNFNNIRTIIAPKYTIIKDLIDRNLYQ